MAIPARGASVLLARMPNAVTVLLPAAKPAEPLLPETPVDPKRPATSTKKQAVSPSLLALAALIRECRKASGMTQQQLAQAVGVGRVTVIRLESGKNIETGTLARIMDLFGLSVQHAHRKTPPR